jgi:hypothetical protein
MRLGDVVPVAAVDVEANGKVVVDDEEGSDDEFEVDDGKVPVGDEVPTVDVDGCSA